MTPETGDAIPGSLAQAFAPIHKLALGVAFGVVLGALLFVVTIATVALAPEGAAFMALLGEYFYGYTLSPAGAFVGFFWGFVVGSVAGWFLAFVHNLAIAIAIFAFRTKAELSQTTDFLDHI
jgi:hypothetical protein